MDDGPSSKDGTPKSKSPRVGESTLRVKTPGSGRQKGTPNKRTLWLSDSLEDAGFSVGEEIRKLYEQASLEQKIHLLTHVLPYLAPKLKEQDRDPNTFDVDSVVLPSTDDLIKMAQTE